MARKSDFSDSFQSTKRGRRQFDDDEVFSAEDQARFEEMRTEFERCRRTTARSPGTVVDLVGLRAAPARPGTPPDWVITDHGAVDYELGVLKTGKEADVFLIERVVPGHRPGRDPRVEALPQRRAHPVQPAGDYTAGRGAQAFARRPRHGQADDVGLEQAAGRWAAAEFDALERMFTAGIPVPYPVQVLGREVIMEFIGEGRTAAPRLAETRPDEVELESLWEQAAEALRRMTELGFAHGDLSPYNTVVHDGRLVSSTSRRSWTSPRTRWAWASSNGTCENLGNWFTSRGIAREEVEDLQIELKALAAMP